MERKDHKDHKERYMHSVWLEQNKCIGCTNCVKRCPTEAIRVKNGKAKIINERCIDCGECIRVCPHRAKKARYDSLALLKRYKYNICLPPPSLYAQFDNLSEADYVLNGLIKCGFDAVYEVAKAAEIVSEYTRNNLKRLGVRKPVISSACPAVNRLIAVRYPDLREHISNVLPPVEYAAKTARAEALANHPELKSEEIGVFFISPCAAKVSYAKNPECVEKSDIDVVVPISEIYFKLVGEMKELVGHPEEMNLISESGIIGLSWASSGGESSVMGEKYLAADGIENVINILDKIELEIQSFLELDFVELNACAAGCVGGVLTVENAYIAKARVMKLRKYLPFSLNQDAGLEAKDEDMRWSNSLNYNPALKLNPDMKKAIKMMTEMETIIKWLPGLDCGACGSPSCKALAEDIVRGESSESDCMVRSLESTRNTKSATDRIQII